MVSLNSVDLTMVIKVFQWFLLIYPIIISNLLLYVFFAEVSICEINEFTCKSGECIALGLYCDSIQDCTDGSDEVNCTVCDPGREIPCRTLNACLPRSLRCDGKMNCPDGSDERDCGPKVECEPDEFSCTNSDCIPKVNCYIISFYITIKFPQFIRATFLQSVNLLIKNIFLLKAIDVI